jgi:hypothetical protein
MKHESPILVVIGTAVGKSMLFQIPTMSELPGPTIVITLLVCVVAGPNGRAVSACWDFVYQVGQSAHGGNASRDRHRHTRVSDQQGVWHVFERFAESSRVGPHCVW